MKNPTEINHPPDMPNGGASCSDLLDLVEIRPAFDLATAGSTDIPVTANDVEETLTFNWNDGVLDGQTTLLTHSEITASDIAHISGQLPGAPLVYLLNKTLKVTFKSDPVNSLTPSGAGLLPVVYSQEPRTLI